jgi:ABC-type branched-subunit amino acid transport system ATPase component
MVVMVGGSRISSFQKQKWRFHSTVGSFPGSLEKAMEQPARIGLDHRSDLPVHKLSCGEQKQLEFAFTQTPDPKVILLDKPACGMAPSERQRIADLILHRPSDITVVLIEHGVGLWGWQTG